LPFKFDNSVTNFYNVVQLLKSPFCSGTIKVTRQKGFCTMKKLYAIITAALLLCGCTQNDNPVTETAVDGSVNNTIMTNVTDNNSYEQGYEQGYADGYLDGATAKKTVTVYGSITATVRSLLPNYVLDGHTNRVAVITLFQDSPCVIPLDENICSKLEVGETYTFELSESTMELPVYLLDNNHYIYSESILDRIRIQDVRAPAEDEYGLECWRIKYYESDDEK